MPSRRSQLARDWMPPRLYHAVQRRRARSRTRTSLQGLAHRIPALESPRVGGFFVELGANDGIRQSNTWWLEAEFGWRGVLVEPALNRYFELVRNRGGGRNHLECAACVGFQYREPLLPLHYSDLETFRVQGREHDDARLRKVARNLPEGEQQLLFGAAARPLQTILDESGAPEVIDFLSLDVEGGELEVLKGVDHARTRFRVALIESNDIFPIRSLLEQHGYAYRGLISHHDHIFEDLRSS